MAVSSFFKKLVFPGLAISTIARHLVEPKKVVFEDTEGFRYLDTNATDFWVLTRVSYWGDCFCGPPVQETAYWSWRRIDLVHKHYPKPLSSSREPTQPSYSGY